MTEPVLSIRDLSVLLPPGGDRERAVDGVSLDLHRGTVTCVVGASGSGKSVLAAAVMAALPPRLAMTGSVTFGGRELTGLAESGLRAIRGNRIAMIPQEPVAALNPVITVGRQIEEVLILHGDLGRAERRRRVAALLASMQLPLAFAARYPHQLSGGQCQRVAIAMAMALAPDVLIADEPTTALDVTTQAAILTLLRADREHALLFITHDFGIVRDIADRVAVMQAGRLVESGTAAEVLGNPQHDYTRALLAAVPELAPKPRRPPAPVVLEVSGLAKRYGKTQALDGVDLELERGTTLAVVGESGSGKTTLARLLVRLAAPDAGQVAIAGADFLALRGAALRTRRSRIQMIFQDPWGSLNLRRSAGGMLARAAFLAGADRATAKARAYELLDLVGLGGEAYPRRPAAFSGGQRQRIGIARALAMQPDILIADESVSALDVLVQRQILELLADLQARLGVAILLITHDLRVAASVADRIAVMRAGRIVEIGDAATILATPAEVYTRALLAAIPGQPASMPGNQRP